MLLLAASIAQAAAAPDFDGDGIDDLLFRDRSQANQRLAVVLGAYVLPGDGDQALLSLGSDGTRSAGFDVRTADFDGDGHTDILDRNLADGRFRVRLMNGTRVRATGSFGAGLESAELAVVADFTGDRRADLLLRDRRSGMWTLQIMRGTLPDSVVSGEVLVGRDLAWRLAGAADFNGDGRTDLLLRHQQTLAWRMFLLDGKQVLKSSTPTFLSTDPAWELEAVADLDADKRADLLFRNRASGAWQAWILFGDRALASSGPVSITTSIAWRLLGVADLNGDNVPDAPLGRYDTSEWRVDFLVGGARLAGSGLIAREPLAEERVAGAGDYDGDGTEELLVSAPEGWKVLNVERPGAPIVRLLDLPPPNLWSLVCEPPQYRQFGAVPKPASAIAGSAFLSWTLPNTRENGEPLCAHELAGFQIHLRKQNSLTKRTVLIKDPRRSYALVDSLSSGTWSFSIVAVDTLGLPSRYSQGVTKTIQ